MWLLVLCVLIDLIGVANVLWGEWFDAAWAPASAALLRFLFPQQVVFSVIQLVEEILPGADFLPTASIGNQAPASIAPRDDSEPDRPCARHGAPSGSRANRTAFFYDHWRQQRVQNAQRIRQ